MYTNSTPNYGFPQYEAQDRIDFMADFNPTFSKIDEVLKEDSDTAISAVRQAEAAAASAASASASAEEAAQSASSARTTATQALNTATQVNQRVANQVGTTYFRVLTQSEYDALPTKSASTVYFVKGDE